MNFPAGFLESLTGLPGFDKEAFVAAHEDGLVPTSVRLNPAKASAADWQLPTDAPPSASLGPHLQQPVPWAAEGRYLSSRPSFTFDPLFHAGCYYVQEASSMFLEQAVRQLLSPDKPLTVLDLCAAPGGKSTHLLSLLSPHSLLVSNEVIKARSLVLADNLLRWGAGNAVVTQTDPRSFQKLSGFFDVLVVDAPCSGSGLFRKDAAAMEEWSPGAVALCSQRQQRILADALPCLKEGGLLIYATCSYAREEDEAIADWLVKEMGMENRSLDTAAFPGVVETPTAAGAVGYRFYPNKVSGEGFFLACFRQQNQRAAVSLRTPKPALVSAAEKAAVSPFVCLDDQVLVQQRHHLAALPEAALERVLQLASVMPLLQAGVAVGEVLKGRLVPHHALAQSTIIAPAVPTLQLPYEEAIRYLQRQPLQTEPVSSGWQVVGYRQKRLGWVNALPNRVNNYYPKEIRILKTRNEQPSND